MYPSGAWRGYWQQVGWGRQPMHDLRLRFVAGTVQGTGHDCIGAFTFHGSYDEQGTVLLVKQYVGRHCVHYNGRYDGEGTIFGRWNIGASWSGPFALSPTDLQADADAPILTIAIPENHE
jgi:hypothetical protein